MTLLTVFSILFCGFIDRMRGDPRDIISRTFEKLLYGLAAGFLCVGLSPVVLAAFAAFFMLGSSPGWGEPIGSALFNHKMHKQKLEWWQVGPLATNTHLALAVRGLIWALPCLPLAYWNLGALAVLAMVPAFAFSPYISRAINDRRYIKDLWAFNEIVRGLMFGAIAACLSLAIQALHV